MNLGEEYSAAEIQATVQKSFGITPRSIERKRSGEYMLQFEDLSSMKKILELNGRSMNGGTTFFKVREFEQVYSVSQIFDFLATKLEARDRLYQYNRGPQPTERCHSPTRDSRYVRITTEDQPRSVRPGDLPNTKSPTQNIIIPRVGLIHQPTVARADRQLH